MDELERRIDQLRAEVRRAAVAGDRIRARELRAELRRAEHAWDDALAEITEPVAAPPPAPRAAGALLPIRDQVHQALTLLTVAAAPKLIVTVHEAFFVGELGNAQLTSLRRDEERSFRSAPHARPYYLCSALTADRLTPARGLLAVSTWPLTRRVIGPLSPRVDFLTAAIRVAEHLDRIGEATLPARQLLWRFAANIPSAVESFDRMKPGVVARAAQAELDVHAEADRSHREEAAARARARLDDVQQLFGAPLGLAAGTATQM
jgi:hypothetical protein